MARKRKSEEGDTPPDQKEEKQQPPITTEPHTKENPSGITQVSPEHAQHLGGLRGFGGPGAAGATVLGGAGFVATEGGSKPLPTKDDNKGEGEGEEPVEYSGGERKTEGAAANENIGNAEGASSPTETGEEPEQEEEGAAPEQHNRNLDEE